MDIQTYNVKLNMKDSGVVSSGIRLKQGDSFMRLLFTIMSGGTEYFDENDIPVVYFRRPDGTTIFGSAGIDTNGYYYEFKGNELQIAGNILCDVKFTLEDGRESTATFTFEVVTDTVSNHTEGHGVYDLDLAEMIKEVEKFAPTVEGYAIAAEGYAIDAHNSAIAAEKAAQEAGADPELIRLTLMILQEHCQFCVIALLLIQLLFRAVVVLMFLLLLQLHRVLLSRTERQQQLMKTERFTALAVVVHLTTMI